MAFDTTILRQTNHVTKFVLKIFHLLNKTLTNDDDDDDDGGYENHDFESDDDFLDYHCGL